MRQIRRVAVLGAGTMGSRIAAHFANAGVPSLLLDLTSGDGSDRSSLARKAVAKLLKQKPDAFYVPAGASLIEPGNFDNDLRRIYDCDWVIEAAPEDITVKRALWTNANKHRSPDTILSTNTSGISIAELARGFPEDFRRSFLGTHFFNPPRYLHLLELVPGELTDSHLVDVVSEFAERALGKGVVVCKDTPNFIANRLGSFFGAAVMRTMIDGGYTIEEADLLTGPIIGIPKSATFRLIDLIGLDVWASMSNNVYERAIRDEWHEWFAPSPLIATMLERGWLGEKSGQGFYKRVGPEKQIHPLDWKTLEYRLAVKASFESVEQFRRIADVGGRIRRLCWTKDKAGDFIWRVLKEYLAYCAARVGEISDGIVEMDRAMRWGYGHKLGPFELWDAIGFEPAARRMESEGMNLPEIALAMLRKGRPAFYRAEDGKGNAKRQYLDFGTETYIDIESRTEAISISDAKRARGTVESNAAASLVDLGDGVLCLEFHSKMNSIGEETLDMIDRGIEALAGFRAMLIANEGDNFSVGANLAFILEAARAGNLAVLEALIRHFQQAMLKIKYAAKPVVAAVFSRALGGGCEIVLQSHRVQASAETYMGLVEVAVGLIPAAGGTKEMALRFADPVQGFELIRNAKVSSNAAEARELGLLRPGDRISMNPERLLSDAKRYALELTESYVAGQPRRDIAAGGKAAYSQMLSSPEAMLKAGSISEHDFTILKKIAHVISGGQVTAGSQWTEQQLLDLEMEAFLSLCGTSHTQERIQHMLQTGKPLHN